MIRTSLSTAQFDEAFAKAQAKFEAAIKGSANPFFKSRYADISAIIDATLEHLNSEGIGVRQHPGLEYRQVGEELHPFMTITTRLSHKGEWEESDLAIPAFQGAKFDAQTCGSALTYGCRYALQGVFVVRREDDDGNAATGRGSSEAAQSVGQDKIAKLKGKASPEPSNSGASLFYALQPSGLYAVTGDVELMRKIYKQFKANLHQDKDGNFYMVSDEQLEVLKFECEQGNIPLHVLKAPNA